MTFKKINNHEFYYEESGSGEAVLFIHGLGSSTLDWEYQLPYFSKNYRTIAIDLKGHGKTKSSEETYSIKGFANDVASFLKEETKPVTIIGISMGGMVAFQLAVDYPHLVKKMVIINSFVEVPLDSRANRNKLRLRKFVPKLLGMKATGKMIAKKVFPYENQEALRNLIVSRWEKNNAKDYVKSVKAIAGWSIKEHLSAIVCPVLVVGAEFDYISSEVKIEYTKQMPNAKFVMIPKVHHAVSMEKPDLLNAVITDFFNKENAK